MSEYTCPQCKRKVPEQQTDYDDLGQEICGYCFADIMLVKSSKKSIYSNALISIALPLLGVAVAFTFDGAWGTVMSFLGSCFGMATIGYWFSTDSIKQKARADSKLGLIFGIAGVFIGALLCCFLFYAMTQKLE